MPWYSGIACLATYADKATSSRAADNATRSEYLAAISTASQSYRSKPFKHIWARKHDNGRSKTVHDFMVADDGTDIFVAFRGTAGVADLWVDTKARTNIAGPSRGFHEGFHARAKGEIPDAA